MRKRKLLLTVVLVLIAFVTFVAWPRTSPPSQITRENFDRINKEMTRADVEALLGPRMGRLSVPPIAHSNGPVIKLNEESLSDGIVRFRGEDQWHSEHGAICVNFDENGHAEYKMWVDVTISDNPLRILIWRLRYGF